GSAPVPLVLDFHQMGFTADGASKSSGIAQLSETQGFIAVWPQGIENSWDIGPCCALSSPVDDFAFVRALVRQLSTEACVDYRRVYAVGYSLGASMAYYLGCRQAEVFAAIAASSMDLFADSLTTCNPSRPITEISFRSVADSVVPYAGGTSYPPGYPDMAMELLGAVGTFQKWATLNSCTGAPTAEDVDGCSTYADCAQGTEVTLCTKQEGTQIFGDANLIWDTLKRHSMP
ncbi:MAG TPA: PHB depolymerase family esterase, partial [Polyangiaceae bacterium]|nr:PHB depolymerase family esterase [Polyangiaceae bacterium]